MPANLNALIRYKEIDRCLRHPQIKATIEVLREKCKERLLHYRGVMDISERTIREDIRIMRSDALGFNAPIVVKNGIYSYEDSKYSIFNTGIQEMELLKDITLLLIEERDHINNDNLDQLLERLTSLTGILISSKRINSFMLSNSYRKDVGINIEDDQKNKQSKTEDHITLESKKLIFLEETLQEQRIDPLQRDKKYVFTWESILDVL